MTETLIDSICAGSRPIVSVFVDSNKRIIIRDMDDPTVRFIKIEEANIPMLCEFLRAAKMKLA